MTPSKDKRIPEGPYFVTMDDAEDAPDHARSGLAKVDTGRTGDWPIARLCEWPTAHLIASIPEMQTHLQALADALENFVACACLYYHSHSLDEFSKPIKQARAALLAAKPWVKGD